MRLILQPGDGPSAIISGINRAKSSIEIMIFRFDLAEVERALGNAVKRGAFVHALIAHRNRAGEDGLRALEMRLLAAGVNVARSADDLVRYHAKFMIIDRRDLYLFAFNFTSQDIERSRSFGLILSNKSLVEEAVRLFEADTKRRAYEPRLASFVVSPINSRKRLSNFLLSAKRELLIYDPMISDAAMIRLLEQQAERGVTIKIIGRITHKHPNILVHRLHRIRLHARVSVCDGRQVFVGSQSLREVELDGRREVGIVVRDRRIAGRLSRTFLEDWELAERFEEKAAGAPTEPASKVAKKVAKAVTKDLLPVTPVLREVIKKEIAGEGAEVDLDPQEVEASVKDAVKEAVKEVVRDVVEEVVEQKSEWATAAVTSNGRSAAGSSGSSRDGG